MAFDLDDEELYETRKLKGLIDFRPVARDITLCTNKFCKNKCKRYFKKWKPSSIQSYINPSMEFDPDGNVKPCKLRLEETNEESKTKNKDNASNTVD